MPIALAWEKYIYFLKPCIYWLSILLVCKKKHCCWPALYRACLAEEYCQTRNNKTLRVTRSVCRKRSKRRRASKASAASLSGTVGNIMFHLNLKRREDRNLFKLLFLSDGNRSCLSQTLFQNMFDKMDPVGARIATLFWLFCWKLPECPGKQLIHGFQHKGFPYDITLWTLTATV